MVANVPSVVGTLPTSTNPPRSAPSAVLSPGSVLEKNVTALPGGAGGPPGRRARPAGPQLHDRGSRALNIAAVVEIADQHVADGDCAAGRKPCGNEGDAVGIHIAIGRYRRGVHRVRNERMLPVGRDALAGPGAERDDGRDQQTRMMDCEFRFHDLILCDGKFIGLPLRSTCSHCKTIAAPEHAAWFNPSWR